MTRAVNIAKHDIYKTWANRKSAVDDVMTDVPDALVTFTAAKAGATSTTLTWDNPASNAGLYVQIEAAPATGTIGNNQTAAPIACTFQDTGDTVTAASHGFQNGDRVVFASVVTTTGIVANTTYYFVVGRTDTTFQVSATSGGGALPLTTNGTGTVYKPVITFVDTGDLVHQVAHGRAAGDRVMLDSIVSTTGISTDKSYYVINPTADTFQLSLTVGGGAVTLTTNGVGVMYTPVYNYAFVATVLGDLETYTHTGLSVNTEYEYRLATSRLAVQPTAQRSIAYASTV
jgi:hypothetical protein